MKGSGEIVSGIRYGAEGEKCEKLSGKKDRVWTKPRKAIKLAPKKQFPLREESFRYHNGDAPL